MNDGHNEWALEGMAGLRRWRSDPCPTHDPPPNRQPKTKSAPPPLPALPRPCLCPGLYPRLPPALLPVTCSGLLAAPRQPHDNEQDRENYSTGATQNRDGCSVDEALRHLQARGRHRRHRGTGGGLSLRVSRARAGGRSTATPPPPPPPCETGGTMGSSSGPSPSSIQSFLRATSCEAAIRDELDEEQSFA